MPAFNYTALNPQGRETKGVLEGDSPRQVRQALRERGLMPVSVETARQKSARDDAAPAPNKTSLKSRDLALITRLLATLIEAGLPVEEAIGAVAQQQEDARIKSLLLTVRAQVLEGQSMAAGLAAFPKAFPELYRATIRAGEQAGHLDLVLKYLADYIESRQRASQKILLAMLYPILLTVVSLAIIAFMLGYVIPDIAKMFSSSGHALPFMTRALIALSSTVKFAGPLVVIAGIAGFFLLRNRLQDPLLRLAFDHRWIRLPFLGKLVRDFHSARFAGTLSILHRSAVPLVEAMKIAAAVLPNRYIRRKTEEAAQSVSEGRSLKAALEETRCYPPILLHMVASGEKSGELDQMLQKAAEQQQQQLEHRVALVVGLFEPAVLLFMGVVVLLLVLAILLPILNLNQLVG